MQMTDTQLSSEVGREHRCRKTDLQDDMPWCSEGSVERLQST